MSAFKLGEYLKESKAAAAAEQHSSNASKLLNKLGTFKLAVSGGGGGGDTGSRSSAAASAEAAAGDGWFPSSRSDAVLPSLSKRQRIVGFVAFIAAGLLCFALCSLYVPVLVLKARKFALLYSIGSLFFVSSFAFLWGPWNHVKHLCSGNRLAFTLIYFATMFATIYVALYRQSYVLTILCALAQVAALVWYISSYIPGGQTGMKFFSKVFYAAASKTVSTALPV